MKKLFLLLVIFGYLTSLNAQEYFPTNAEIKSTTHNYTAFTNATLYVTPTNVIKNGTLLIKDGKVVNAGNSVTIPKNSIIIDLKGKSIYPSFIDLYSDFGLKKPKGTGFSFFGARQYGSNNDGYYWNEHVTPEKNAIDGFKYNSKGAKQLLDAGFGVVLSNQKNAVARGSAVLVALNNFDNNHTRIIANKASQNFGFTRSSTSKQLYPTSLMGMIALLRQMFYDASWYKTHKDMNDATLDGLIAAENLPKIFDAGKKFNDLRVAKLGKEFNFNFIIKGGGDEYESIDAIKNTNAKYIIPINFPAAFDVSNPISASKISLSDMLAWNQAPTNPGVMAKNNIPFSLTYSGIKNSKSFKTNLLKAIENGLDKTKALEALTTLPASFIGKQSEIGSLNKGSWANFLIASGDIFDKKTILYENWTQGRKNVINDATIIPVNGDYTLNLGNTSYKMSLSGNKVSSPSITLKKDSTKIKAKISYKNGWLSINFKPVDKEGFNRISAKVGKNGILKGLATLYNGAKASATFTKLDSKSIVKSDKKKAEKNTKQQVLATSYPNMAYGYKSKPKQQTILIKNATVWTNEKAGILKNTDVLLKNGKIAKIGKNLKSKNALVIDGTGKHLTTGIIDEHSHIAGEGINEAGHNSSAEVRMLDVLNSEDIGIYRNLAGGVTTSQILHGSANPIGGQSAIIKLKWGVTPEEIVLKTQPKFIKFALGENVKQSRSSGQIMRYPQTRMGVEQVFMDYFTRAKEYDNKKKKGLSVRYDLELETIAEIINGERYISCHSYVQSEINMLMAVADKFNFTVNTFTHILEGYKVADKMKKHGVGASTFSDWWAYKYEVNDAIPYNAAIMHSLGITVAINSDDSEMSRRLNQEAAKSIKYGGVSEEDAWKFVTLNPAKLLHIDNKLGSMKVGKDADVVLWSANPLSIYAHAEKTIIEGTIYFDYAQHQQMLKDNQQRRNTLINMMLSAKSGGAKTRKPFKRKPTVYTCETLEMYNLNNN